LREGKTKGKKRLGNRKKLARGKSNRKKLARGKSFFHSKAQEMRRGELPTVATGPCAQSGSAGLGTAGINLFLDLTLRKAAWVEVRYFQQIFGRKDSVSGPH
jgi:hypothetical protein